MPEQKYKPPKTAIWILNRLSVYEEFFEVTKDFEEEFFYKRKETGKFRAFLWLWIHTIKTLCFYILLTFSWGVGMFKNYIKIALRNCKNHKAYSAIIISGLTIGLSITIVIAFYVIDDLTFDRFHEDADTIFRLSTIVRSGNQEATWSITAGPMPPALKEEIPEIIGSARIHTAGTRAVIRGNVQPDNDIFSDAVQARAILADPGFFDVFSFKLLSSDRSKVLKEHGGVLITEKIAEAVFGDDDPLNQAVTVRGIENAFVIGIVEEPPHNSHIQFEMIIPLRVDQNPFWFDSWENLLLTGYVRIDKNADPSEVEKKIMHVNRSHNFPEVAATKLQPLLKIHLGSSHHTYDFTNRNKNDKNIVLALSIIGIMVLVIASINFINLSSARASRRAREIGMRKVVGSSRKQLVMQFIGESILFTIAAMIIAVIIVQLSLPHLDSFIRKQLNLNLIVNPFYLFILLACAVFIGILSGIYPAFILSAIKPLTVLKGIFTSGKSGVYMRRILVIFQFTITITLIFGIMMILNQIEYLKSRNLGYNREQVLVIRNSPRNGEDLLAENLKNVTSVISIGRISNMLGQIFTRIEVVPEGFDRSNSQMFQRVYINEGLIPTLDISLKYGHNYSKEKQTELQDGIIVNEAVVKMAGWEDPIGKKLTLIHTEDDIQSKNIIGVVKDFHYTSVRNNIEAMLLLYGSGSRNLLVRISKGEIESTINQIENIHKNLYPDRQFNYFFLDDVFNDQFQSDRLFASYVGYLARTAIFIACLGLIGLVSFAVEQRRKEIAIRKVLGSGDGKIFSMLVSDFLKWIVLANLFAWPCSYFATGTWLEGFAYKVPITIGPFIISGISAFIIALITMSVQSLRASRANPVDNLRFE